MHVSMYAYLNYPKNEELPNAISLVYEQQADICESTSLEEKACASKLSENVFAKSSVCLRVPKYAARAVPRFLPCGPSRTQASKIRPVQTSTQTPAFQSGAECLSDFPTSCSRYVNKLTISDLCIKNLWRILYSFSPETRQKFIASMYLYEIRIFF